jgi:hypothetical protein
VTIFSTCRTDDPSLDEATLASVLASALEPAFASPVESSAFTSALASDGAASGLESADVVSPLESADVESAA